MELDAKFRSKTFTSLESLYWEEVRLSTFIEWPSTILTPEELAKEGFYYLRVKDSCACAFCRGIIGAWEEGDTPRGEHKRHFPHCAFVQGKVTPNVTLAKGNILRTVSRKVLPEIGPLPTSSGFDVCGTGKPDLLQTYDCCSDRKVVTKSSVQEVSISGLGLQRYCGPKRKEYLTFETRFNSFPNWPQTLNQKPKELAEAGFYYCGISDHVSCFHCDNGLRNWERTDDPWEEHAKWFPDCHFVLLEKGLDFIEKVGRKGMSSSDKSNENELLSAGKSLSSDVLSELKQLNLAPKLKEKSNTEDNKIHQNDVEMKPFSENRICKVCMDKELDVVFLPCSHMSTCSSCAVALTACPICRSPIHYAIKALIS